MDASTVESDLGSPSDHSSSVPPIGFNPVVFVCLVAVLGAVSWQNWWLRRRAEGVSLVPDWLQQWLRGDRS